MKRLTIVLAIVPLVATAFSPKADNRATVVAGHARFTVLTDRMIRMEYAPDGAFEDRATLTFVNRELPVPSFKVERQANGCTINTGALRLVYEGGDFSPETLSIKGKNFSWKYGDADNGNLMGTTRTLDGVGGWDTLLGRMEKGLLSRDGWTIVDDTTRHLFVPTGDAWGNWVAPRKVKDGAADLYFFGYGHDYKGCLGDYVKVAGRIPLPPRWAFGYWWSRYWLYTDSEIRELLDQMKSVGYPLDVFIIDMEWHETWHIADRPDEHDEFGNMWGWTGYTWNKRLFPDPKSTLDYLHSNGCKVALNLHPASGVQPVEDCYAAFCRDYGWTSGNAVPYRATERKWCESYFKTVLGPLEKQGVDFWWLDWQQWNTDNEVKDLSCTFWLNYIFDRHMANRRNGAERPFIYHRWGGLGSHRYQVGFSGDCKVSWKMLETIPWFTATASNVGYGYWGHDIGGHHDPDPGAGTDGELFVRWLQSGVFTPIFKTHSTKDSRIERRIWKYPEHFLVLRDALDLRYRLAPYIYTAARQAYDTGVSMCRPMYYEESEDDRAYNVKNAYLFGDAILAATVTRPTDSETGCADIKLYFPRGRWYDVSTGELLDGGATLSRSYTIDQNPWFVKAGAIIPMCPKSVRNLANPGTDELELFFAPGADNGSCVIYEDGGTNPDYMTNFRKTRVVRKGNKIAIGPRAGVYTLRFPCLAPPKRVTVNGAAVGWTYDVADLAVVVRTPRVNGAKPTVIELTMPKDAAEIQRMALGLKGEFKWIDALAQRYKNSMYSIHWAINVPESWQSFWQTPAAIAANPAKLGELLRRREEYRAQFAIDLEKRAHQLSDDLARQLRSVVLPQPKLTIAPSGDAEVDRWANSSLRSLIEGWYRRLVRDCASREYRVPEEIRVRFGSDMGGTPGLTTGNEMTLDRGWCKPRLETEVPGMVVHELVHVVQQYKGSYPGWFCEGFADYVRWYLFEPEGNGCNISNWDSPDVRYDGSYRLSANFLNWVSRKYGVSVIKKVDAACRAGNYREELWQELTGRSAADLGAEWKTSKGQVL